MRYFQMIKAWEPEVIGVKDGTVQAEVWKDGFKNSLNYETFMRVFANPSVYNPETKLNSSFDLESVKLRKHAILTDFLWFSPMLNCLVNPKAFRILTGHNLCRHRFYPATVEDLSGKKMDEYHLFYVNFFDTDIVDFKNSEFTTGSKIKGFKTISINSDDDIGKLKTFYQVRKLKIKDIDPNIDLFAVKLDLDVIISERLHNALVAESVTGIRFSEIDIELG